MKPARILICLASALIAGPALADAGPSVYGKWVTDDESGVVEVVPCGDALCGILVCVLDPAAPAHDVNNPDPELRSRPLVGVRILTGLKRSGSRWQGGRAYDPKVGRSYRARIALGSPTRLDVTGCVLFLCQTRHWTRLVKENRR